MQPVRPPSCAPHRWCSAASRAARCRGLDRNRPARVGGRLPSLRRSRRLVRRSPRRLAHLPRHGADQDDQRFRDADRRGPAAHRSRPGPPARTTERPRGGAHPGCTGDGRAAGWGPEGLPRPPATRCGVPRPRRWEFPRRPRRQHGLEARTFPTPRSSCRLLRCAFKCPWARHTSPMPACSDVSSWSHASSPFVDARCRSTIRAPSTSASSERRGSFAHRAS